MLKLKKNPILEKYNYRLLYAIGKHAVLGYCIEAYSVRVNQDSSFTLFNQKTNQFNINKSRYSISEVDNDIIKIIDECSEQSIANKFGKKNKLYKDFLQKEFNEELFTKHIRPFIEKKIHKILSLIQAHSIHLYYKGSKKEYIREKEVEICEDKTRTVFNFEDNGKEIKYYLTLRNRDKVIHLHQKQSVFLCQQPTWLYLDQKLYHFEKNFDAKKLEPFFEKPYILVPERFREKYFSGFILNIIKKHEDIHNKGFDIKIQSPNPIPLLKIKKTWQGYYVFVLYFLYNGKMIAANESQQCFVDLHTEEKRFSFCKLNRNIAKEEAFIRCLSEKQLEQKSDSEFISLNSNQNDDFFKLIQWLHAHQKEIEKLGFHVDCSFEGKSYFTGYSYIDFTIKEQNDWFDIYALVRFGKFEIPFYQLKNHINSGKREFELPDGTYAVIPSEWFSQYKDILNFAKPLKNKLCLKKHHFPFLHGIQGIQNTYLQKIIRFYSSAKPKSIKLPKEIKVKLRTYQKEGFFHLYHTAKHGFGMCLADDMGLGKTVQTLILLQKHKEEQELAAIKEKENTEKKSIQLDLFSFSNGIQKTRTSLIVMPTSLIYNWISEINKFTPKLNCIAHTGPNRLKSKDILKNYDIVLTSYGILRNDLHLLGDIDFHYVILDESQFIKNPASKIYKAVNKLKAYHKITLTGTPIENSLLDLWAQLSFLNPGLLGSMTYFQDEYLIPVEKNQDENKQEKLKKIIAPFILRRTKSEVEKELPELTESVRFCDMAEKQQSFYESKKSEIRNLLISNAQIKGNMFNILKGLTQLRLIANHPVLFDKNQEKLESGKYDEVIRLIENLSENRHKILIYSSFVKHLHLFARHFDQMQWNYEFLSGSVPEPKRKEIINNFQNRENTKLFLLSIKAGGVGLNLTAADYVFILDPWWNPAVEVQALNRAHRIGQDKKVFAYRFISKDSIEEKILNLQNRKKELANNFLSNNNPLRNMNEEEIRGLFA